MRIIYILLIVFIVLQLTSCTKPKVVSTNTQTVVKEVQRDTTINVPGKQVYTSFNIDSLLALYKTKPAQVINKPIYITDPSGKLQIQALIDSNGRLQEKVNQLQDQFKATLYDKQTDTTETIVEKQRKGLIADIKDFLLFLFILIMLGLLTYFIMSIIHHRLTVGIK